MALIKCPECGKEVSSQLKKCNNCGYKLKQLDKKKKIIISVVTIILVLLVSIFIVVGITLNKKQQEKLNKEYHDLLVETSGRIYVNSLLASVYCYDIGQVWYNTIFEISDSNYDKYTKSTLYGFSSFNSNFSESINNYLTMNSDKIDNLKEEKKEIEKMILELQNQPNDKYKDAYDKVIELYGIYNSLTDQAISPSGTYRDYVSKYNKYVEDLKSTYEQLVVLIPELKDYKIN